MFSENINFKFQHGKTKFKTVMGGISSILVGVLILWFSVVQSIKMTKYVNVYIAEEIQPFFYNENFQFGEHNPEFTIAFALATFMESNHSDYSDYGTISAHYEWWTPEDNAEVPIRSRPCTPKDFGLEPNENQRFFNVAEQKKPEFLRLMHRLQCIDESLSIYGDWNTATAQVIFLAFHPCDSKVRKTCRSKAEIDEWLQNKYIVFVYNKYVFDHDGFNQRTFTKYATLDWINYDTMYPTVTPF